MNTRVNNIRRKLHIAFALTAGLLALVGVLALLGTWRGGPIPAHARVVRGDDLGDLDAWSGGVSRSQDQADSDAVHYVAPDCSGVSTPCHTTVQAAVDAVDGPDDEIWVAAGTYTDTIARTATYTTTTITQVVYISKSLTLRGGYTTADGFAASDPDAHPTVLDAEGRGRVVFVGQPSEEPVTVTLEHLTLTDGDATGLSTLRNGGGVCVVSATATLRGNEIISNTGDFGGGVFLGGGSDATLDNNVIVDNQADVEGSGVFLEFESTADLRHNTIARNTGGDGSGVSLILGSSAALTNNILVSHTVGLAVGSHNNPCTATLESTLWATGTAWANVTPTVTGDAGVIAAANNVTGTPDFADPDNGDYHIGFDSAALNAGVDAGVTTDIDGESRDARPDLGADEYPPVWTHDGDQDEWEFGTPSNSGGPDHCASSPEGCWVTDLDDNYNSNADESLYSPPIIVPASASLPLSATWQQAWYIEDADYDRVYADYRCNGGTGVNLWQHSNTSSDVAEGWQAAPGAPFTLACGLSDTVQFRFRLTSDGSETHPGYYVDDLRVYDADGRTLYSTDPPRISKAAEPTEIRGEGETVTYSLRVTNTRATNPAFAISDTLDSHQKPLNVAADRGTCAVADGGWGGGVTCTVPSLAVDESVAVTVTAQTTDWIDAFQIVNSAVVSDGLQTAEAQATVEVDACYVRLVEGGTTTTTHDTIQDAVDAASDSDSEVLVAGVCGDLSTREGETQIAYISKTLTLRGGYNSDFTAHDPDQYPTVLDAQGQGRALYIADPGTVTVTHLTLTGGNDGSGGAVYAHLATMGSTSLSSPTSSKATRRAAAAAGFASAATQEILITVTSRCTPTPSGATRRPGAAASASGTRTRSRSPATSSRRTRR